MGWAMCWWWAAADGSAHFFFSFIFPKFLSNDSFHSFLISMSLITYCICCNERYGCNCFFIREGKNHEIFFFFFF